MPELGGYRFGAGDVSLGEAQEKQPDAFPLSEKVIEWKSERGSIAVQRQLAIPASSIKGALSHRVAFHHNRFNMTMVAESNPAVNELFGNAKDTDKGNAGCVWIEDVMLPIQQKKIATQQHNSIDRFTGGTRNGVLFSEEIVHDHTFTLKLHISKKKTFSSHTLQSLQLALQDLAEGRLALGASAAKGHGYFSGQLAWPSDLTIGERK